MFLGIKIKKSANYPKKIELTNIKEVIMTDKVPPLLPSL